MAVLLVAAGVRGSRGRGPGDPAFRGPGPARDGEGSAITKVEVRPGQSLWTLAEAYDPNADTRLVIQEILQLNSMSTDQVQPGQVLWMPRALSPKFFGFDGRLRLPSGAVGSTVDHNI